MNWTAIFFPVSFFSVLIYLALISISSCCSLAEGFPGSHVFDIEAIWRTRCLFFWQDNEVSNGNNLDEQVVVKVVTLLQPPPPPGTFCGDSQGRVVPWFTSLLTSFVCFFPFPVDMVESAFYLCAYELAIKTVNSPWCQLLDEVDAQVHTSFAVPIDGWAVWLLTIVLLCFHCWTTCLIH